ncbi:competence ComEA helix-hairpin-helix repeat region domain protein [Geobacillus kaustophilus]|uniref:Competence ComEA helix-hairpin-helix repeat region domain protein n=1 Tax=Geobacillus kaustophilus TaxID=1462 RepID=A0A0D8BRW5_GEOKU|nr:helix-hairpin-helix domain-containing protein [Geobacillus kaustophilus]KJE26157.1 competence ComEA helix-hairpin-helix repeat region domain protein [Geobacillus kaustophilus]
MWEQVQELGKRYGKVGVLLLFAVAAGLWVFRHPTDEKGQVVLPAAETDAAQSEAKKEEAPKTAVVDVKGAVAKPGVYEVAADARIRDVIVLAGGLTDEADETKVNLAAKVRDEMMIYVPAKGEAAPASETTGAAPKDEAGIGPQVAVNTATEEELMQLPGIGPAKAKAIIAYREEHGPFRRAEDLLNVTGIGEKTLEKLKPYLLVP